MALDRLNLATLKSQLRPHLTRRNVLAASGLAAAAGLLSARPADHGGAHNGYFKRLSEALREAGLARPTLIVDKALLHQNIDTLMSRLAPGTGSGMNYRIVAKSLPALGLIKEVSARARTKRLMVFHQPFLNLIAQTMPAADLLLGKPMPVAAAARFYRHLKPGPFDPARQVQWLIDSPGRLAQYRDLANAQDLTLNINIELDVGLHRGGLTTLSDLDDMLTIIEAAPRLTFTGFMGYDPQLAGVPTLLGWQQRALETSRAIYQQFNDRAAARLGQAARQNWTLNTAGSPTYALHTDTRVANEVAVGSALVKPSHFDVPTLSSHVPAAFIATPVIKSIEKTQLPVLEVLSGPRRWWDTNQTRAFFIYGGKWMAEPVSPPGLQLNGFFGRSTNQEMLNGSAKVDLKPDDYVFLRPDQSEFVFLQFGDIAVYDQGKIVDQWPVFTQGA